MIETPKQKLERLADTGQKLNSTFDTKMVEHRGQPRLIARWTLEPR